jgi:DNA-binding response OmpR family regulator
MKKIVILESEEILLSAIEFRLKKQGYQVLYCPKLADILHFISIEKPNILIVDFDMKKKTGLAIIEKLRKEYTSPLGILLVADPEEEESILAAFDLNVDDFLPKPFKPAELILRARRIMNNNLIKLT